MIGAAGERGRGRRRREVRTLGTIAVPAAVAGPGGQLIPLNPLHDVAVNAANSAFQLGYIVCDGAGAVACLLAVFALARMAGEAEHPVDDAPAGNPFA